MSADALLAAAVAGDIAAVEEATAGVRVRRRGDGPPATAPVLRLARAGGGAALLEAAAADDEDAVYALLVLGVDPNVRGADGRTPLHAAAAAGALDAVGVLAGWARVDRDARDADGRTALELADDRAVVAALTPRAQPATGRHGEAAWRADAGFLLAQPGERRRVGDGVAVRSGAADNTRNGVVCDHATDAEVAAALAWLADVPARWLIGPASTLGPALERAGCTPERTAVHMAIETAALPEPDLAPDVLEDGPSRLLTVPGARAETFTEGDVCLLVELEVERGRRRQGLGSALAVTAMRASGAALAVLAPTPATIPFYERLGMQLERYPADRVYYVP